MLENCFIRLLVRVIDITWYEMKLKSIEEEKLGNETCDKNSHYAVMRDNNDNAYKIVMIKRRVIISTHFSLLLC